MENDVDNNKIQKSNSVKKNITINLFETKYSSVKKSSLSLGWKVSKDEHDAASDVYWVDVGIYSERFSKLKLYQKINHFPGMNCLSRKNNLARNIQKLQKTFPKEFNFIPKTWLMPSDITVLRQQFQQRNRAYIVKPEAQWQGKGIFITRNWDDIENAQNCVVQEYIKKPYLIEGLKFDLRIYVCVTGCDPLRIFIHEDGLTRFATHRYSSPSKTNSKDMCMHLTNYAINKNEPEFKASADETGSAHKRSLMSTYYQLQQRGHDVRRLKNRINDLIIKSLTAVQPQLASQYRSHQPRDTSNSMAFEILGLDILINSNLKPLLLEVNHSPSFSTDSILDRQIKQRVIQDTLALINVKAKHRYDYFEKRKAEMQERNFTRRQIKLSREEFVEAASEAATLRDVFESDPKNLGGYTKIYPNKRTSYYEKFLVESERQWFKLTGLSNCFRETEPNKISVKPTTVDTTKHFRNSNQYRNQSRDTKIVDAEESPGRGVSVYERLTKGQNYTKPLMSDRQLITKDAPKIFYDRRNRRSTGYFQEGMQLQPIQRKTSRAESNDHNPTYKYDLIQPPQQQRSSSYNRVSAPTNIKFPEEGMNSSGGFLKPVLMDFQLTQKIRYTRKNKIPFI